MQASEKYSLLPGFLYQGQALVIIHVLPVHKTRQKKEPTRSIIDYLNGLHLPCVTKTTNNNIVIREYISFEIHQFTFVRNLIF